MVKKKAAKGGGALQSPKSVLAPSTTESEALDSHLDDVEVILVDDLYALQRCPNCTFWHFALCVNCPRCNEPQVHATQDAPNESFSGGGAERAGTDETDETALLAARLFAELDTQQLGRLPAEALIRSVRAHFHTQPTEQPEHWVRTLIVKSDGDRDGELEPSEFAHALSCLVRS